MLFLPFWIKSNIHDKHCKLRLSKLVFSTWQVINHVENKVLSVGRFRGRKCINKKKKIDISMNQLAGRKTFTVATIN